MQETSGMNIEPLWNCYVDKDNTERKIVKAARKKLPTDY